MIYANKIIFADITLISYLQYDLNYSNYTTYHANNKTHQFLSVYAKYFVQNFLLKLGEKLVNEKTIT